jgi:hypothetical protein
MANMRKTSVFLPIFGPPPLCQTAIEHQQGQMQMTVVYGKKSPVVSHDNQWNNLWKIS